VTTRRCARARAPAALAVLALALGACTVPLSPSGTPGARSGPVASAESDTAVDFARYRSFGWQPGVQPLTGEPRVDDPFLHQRIEKAVEDEMVAKGFAPAAPGAADLLLVYRLALREDFQAGALDTAGAPGPSWAPGVQSQLFGRATKRGSMVLDMIDPERRAIVWRGQVESEVGYYADPDQQLPRVQRAVRALLSRFPPPSAGAGPESRP
jgi:hypothetical protein